MSDGTNETTHPARTGSQEQVETAARECATRASYDAIAETYTDWISAELTAKPHDRAVLGAFSELVLSTGHSETLEIGCGPGRITAFLAALGLSPSGLDLSPAMIAQATRLYPNLDFTTGSMTALPNLDNSVSGLVAWYSIIHIPDESLPTVFAEAARVLRPGGWFQLAFQLGDRVDHQAQAAGFDVDLDFHRRSIEQVLTIAEDHGFTPVTRIEREPDRSGPFPESTRQGYLLVRLATTSSDSQ
ncbi:MAG: class I SAM-dependent methyltransferase [Brevibacterium aurantiacum]|uniref:Methyltransferase n=1 Tax=Brevibacterium aurantiacum TaxID=273384 RepID=A0A1D7W429_BREAU|nr:MULTISPECIES: class I SAM-dependent methyltransferase [Brevibacterium]MDN5550314.1 class I SAM-dependent methyltransferase [Brevibacterium sp.]AOP53817.1 methyltransferase [Brevibacterium aurantiacum]AZL05934.1 class I SAM-dependent methyltransferase [Brevibacterium aurantiacum]AZL09495.1 class I SAM-dependent methyltransferase [Brevibacterium aurantiacum]AZL13129.1 class I SAM-dependent methyltransferase [Brevibacterium aurantiacum]